MGKKDKRSLYKNSEFYFDHCAICQSMKQAESQGKELSSRELKTAFSKSSKNK